MATPLSPDSFSFRKHGNTDPAYRPDTNIVIVFSEASDVSTLSKGFSITPPVEGVFAWAAARKQITFDPV
jgi:hypothetical protein